MKNAVMLESRFLLPHRDEASGGGDCKAVVAIFVRILTEMAKYNFAPRLLFIVLYVLCQIRANREPVMLERSEASQGGGLPSFRIPGCKMN